MELSALFPLVGVGVGIVVVGATRAIAWLIAAPKGTFVDALLAADVEDDDDLHSRTPAQRDRYRALRR